MAEGHRRWRPGVATSLSAEEQHVLVPSSRRWSHPAEPDAPASVAQVPGAETGYRLEETGVETAATAVSRLVIYPQVPRGHQSVHHGRGLLHDADGLGRRDDAAIGVQRCRLVVILFCFLLNP